MPPAPWKSAASASFYTYLGIVSGLRVAAMSADTVFDDVDMGVEGAPGAPAAGRGPLEPLDDGR